MGPAGPAGTPGGGRELVDSLNSEVGYVENLREGIISRSVGGDQVLLYANADGFAGGAVVFYHMTTTCSTDRLLPYVNGPGFAFLGQVFGSSLVYTRMVDPNGGGGTVEPVAMEMVLPGEDIHAPGACMAMSVWPQPMGRAEVVDDPAVGLLRPPFRLR